MRLLDGDVEVATWCLGGLTAPDLALVDALARLQLAARRLGWSIRVRDAGGQLAALLDLVGLAEVLPLEARGEPEGREQLRVEEVVETGDAPV